jgi:hypothetical protein
MHHYPQAWRAFVAAILAAFALASNGRAETEFVQPRAHFEKAIRDMSTSNYVIFATFVNDKTGEAHTDCIDGALLVGALVRENDLGHDVESMEKAREIALANPSRVFHFSKQAAIDNIPLFGRYAERFLSRYRDACILVKQGRSVFLGDRGPGGVDP